MKVNRRRRQQAQEEQEDRTTEVEQDNEEGEGARLERREPRAEDATALKPFVPPTLETQNTSLRLFAQRSTTPTAEAAISASPPPPPPPLPPTSLQQPPNPTLTPHDEVEMTTTRPPSSRPLTAAGTLAFGLTCDLPTCRRSDSDEPESIEEAARGTM